jgi:predicted RNA methylase
VSDVLFAPLNVGSPVAVRDLYTGVWHDGFTVEEPSGSPPWGYRLRRRSDNEVLAKVVPALDVIPSSARR